MTRVFIGERNAHIFISYSRKDADLAKDLFSELARRKHDPFLDTINLTGGDDWRNTLRKEISCSDLMVVIVTPHSNESDYVYEEIYEAERHFKRIVPLQLEETTPLPIHLRGRWNAIKASNISEAVLKIENAIRNLPSISIQLPALLTIIGLLILGLIAGSVFGAYVFRMSDSPPPITCSSRPSLTSSAHIMAPENCRTQIPISKYVDISGTYDTQIADQSLWIMVYFNGLYWPQVICQTENPTRFQKGDGLWHSQFMLSGTGQQYDVVLVSTDPNSSADTQLQDWAKTGCSAGKYPGIPMSDLVNGVTELDSITVVSSR